MLNYIWAGLIVASLAFALTKDFSDMHNDTYRNGAMLPVIIKLDSPEDLARDVPRAVHVVMDPQQYRAFYHNDETPAASYPAQFTSHANGAELRFAADTVFPKPLAKMKEATTPEDDRRMSAEVTYPQKSLNHVVDGQLVASLKFQKIRFQTVADIVTAGVNAAKMGVINIAFPLI